MDKENLPAGPENKKEFTLTNPMGILERIDGRLAGIAFARHIAASNNDLSRFRGNILQCITNPEFAQSQEHLYTTLRSGFETNELALIPEPNTRQDDVTFIPSCTLKTNRDPITLDAADVQTVVAMLTDAADPIKPPAIIRGVQTGKEIIFTNPIHGLPTPPEKIRSESEDDKSRGSDGVWMDTDPYAEGYFE